MAEIERSVVVGVPVKVAYDQWTQFESFPEFMQAVTGVRQLDDRTLEWTARIAGREERWKAVITDQEPDRRVAWRSVEGAVNAGDVRFAPEGEDSTRVTLHLVYEPHGVTETVASALGLTAGQVDGDLQRFKRFIEERGEATGAWRGEIHQPAPEGARNPNADRSTWEGGAGPETRA
jgi:uncharacterized membrane protein